MEGFNVINLKFGLFWAGGKISYLRYLTFLSLRKFHPKAIIELYVSDNYNNQNVKWHHEKQDFQNKNIKHQVEWNEFDKLDIKIKKIDRFEKYHPNFQSDVFRWWWLQNNNGFYLDTDQIILKSFSGIDRNYDFIYSEYKAPSCGIYSPVGVIGGNKNSEIITWINAILPQFHDSNDYNSMGPFMLRSILRTKKWEDDMFNTGSELFYPIKDSCFVPSIYQKTAMTEEIYQKTTNAYALHWYGGHPLSQQFNAEFNEEQAQTSLNLMSYILRERGII